MPDTKIPETEGIDGVFPRPMLAKHEKYCRYMHIMMKKATAAVSAIC